MPPSSDPVIDDAIERLVFEFAGRVSPQTVAAVVRHSRNDLDSCPPAALPELTERLARQRVHDRLPGVASAVQKINLRRGSTGERSHAIPRPNGRDDAGAR